jgi:hypothetical protein
MKTAALALILVTAVGAAGATEAQVYASDGPASAHYGASDAAAPRLPTPLERYRREVLQLRSEVVRVKARDGGELTAADKAQYQARLDALNRRYNTRG